jgi:hypothetical protein
MKRISEENKFTLHYLELARGTAKEDSKVALVSPVFTGDRFMDRQKIVPFRREINTSIEPMPFRPEDFAEDEILVEEIRSHGEEIVLGLVSETWCDFPRGKNA